VRFEPWGARVYMHQICRNNATHRVFIGRGRASQLALGRHVQRPAAHGDEAIHGDVVRDLQRDASVVRGSEGRGMRLGRGQAPPASDHAGQSGSQQASQMISQPRTVISATTLE
jgi:hypothetical protein